MNDIEFGLAKFEHSVGVLQFQHANGLLNAFVGIPDHSSNAEIVHELFSSCSTLVCMEKKKIDYLTKLKSLK